MRRLAIALGLVACATASASASAATIKVDPGTVQTGHKVRLHGKVADCSEVVLLSHAFPHHHEFAGVASVTIKVQPDGHYSRRVRIPANPGTYKITGRCGGGNLGVEAKLKVIS
jgi:hypothetical protein